MKGTAHIEVIGLLPFLSTLLDLNIEYNIAVDDTGAIPTDVTITWTREAMDSVGFRVGSEVYTASFPIFLKEKIGHPLPCPPALDAYAVLPKNVTVLLAECPEERQYCNGDQDIGEGYTPPDEEFAWYEWERHIRQIQEHGIPDYCFDAKTRTWTIGNNFAWTVGEPALVADDLI